MARDGLLPSIMGTLDSDGNIFHGTIITGTQLPHPPPHPFCTLTLCLSRLLSIVVLLSCFLCVSCVSQGTCSPHSGWCVRCFAHTGRFVHPVCPSERHGVCWSADIFHSLQLLAAQCAIRPGVAFTLPCAHLQLCSKLWRGCLQLELHSPCTGKWLDLDCSTLLFCFRCCSVVLQITVLDLSCEFPCSCIAKVCSTAGSDHSARNHCFSILSA